MPLAPAYVTTAELKAYLRITDVTDDIELDFAISAASRAIDSAANRHFGQDDSPVARYYTHSPTRAAATVDTTDPFRGLSSLEVADIATTTGLLVDLDTDEDGTWSTALVLDTDFFLHPFNAAAEGRPWTRIVLSQDAAADFPRNLRGVRVTATFGWPTAVPDAIKKAALVQASRFFARRNAPFGVAGSPEIGSELRLLARLDPDVAVIVAGYKRHWGTA